MSSGTLSRHKRTKMGQVPGDISPRAKAEMLENPAVNKRNKSYKRDFVKAANRRDRHKAHDKIPDTTPIENILPIEDFTKEYMGFCFSLPRPRDLVKIHQAKLGKQSTVFQGEFRMWVWTRPTWTVFISNIKGICFEVLEGTSVEKAWEAWHEYQKAMKS